MNTATSWSLLRRKHQDISYRLLGPTAIHIQHELYLVVALSLLVLSSLHALYKESFGLIGDVQFTIVTTVWLARFLLLRWWITSDTSTNLRPTLTGVWVHWITSYVMAGQYFDRPTPEVIAKQIGTTHHQHSGGVDDIGRTPGGGVTIKHFFIPSILFSVQYIKVWIWYPLLTIYERVIRVPHRLQQQRNYRHQQHKFGTTITSNTNIGSNSNKGIRQASTPSSSSTIPISMLLYWKKFWKFYGPSLQTVIPMVTVLFMLFHTFLSSSESSSSSAANSESPHALTMHTYTSSSSSLLFAGISDGVDIVKPYGSYKKMEQPPWGQVLYYLSFGGTILGIFLYGRIVLPIPDLVAGTNVLKAVRNESKNYGTSSSGTSNANATSGKSSRGSKTHRENTIDQPWLEQYKSIVSENRFRLVCKVAMVRIVENFFLCVIFPRTAFACRVTGHCSADNPTYLDLSKIFFHVGITSPLRTDYSYQNQYATLQPDRGSAIMALISVVVITMSLLVAQAATLNRSYLGIMGYLAGEWVVVNAETDPSILEGSARPSQWDPKRRYKKGDLIYENNLSSSFGKVVYRATSNNPEGRPSDLYLRATHDVFRNELGHPATSHVIAFLSALQFGLVGVIILVILAYQTLDYNSASLLWTLAANLVAVYGTIGVAVPNYSEYEQLAREINGTN